KIAEQAGEDLTQVVFRQGVRRFLVKPVEFAQINHVLRSGLNASAQMWHLPSHIQQSAIEG
ncbi:MAG TPA: hypothetical protein VIW47_06865, partial [Nitrospiraceae bacterium]